LSASGGRCDRGGGREKRPHGTRKERLVIIADQWRGDCLANYTTTVPDPGAATPDELVERRGLVG
jgi:hypothetical protein